MSLRELGLIVDVVVWTCAFIVPLCAAWLAVAGVLVIARRWERVRVPTQPNPVIEVGDDAIAMIREARRADKREADAWTTEEGDERG